MVIDCKQVGEKAINASSNITLDGVQSPGENGSIKRTKTETLHQWVDKYMNLCYIKEKTSPKNLIMYFPGEELGKGVDGGSDEWMEVDEW